MKVIENTPISISSIMKTIENGMQKISFLSDNVFQIEIKVKPGAIFVSEIKMNLKSV